jgi:hypothetical protein
MASHPTALHANTTKATTKPIPASPSPFPHLAPHPASPIAGQAAKHSIFSTPDAESEADPSTDDLLISSFDDPNDPVKLDTRLGFKDELEVRFIWDRVLGRSRHGTVVRAVIDRFTGCEYACKRMPKVAPDDVLISSSTADRKVANAQQLEHIKREIGLFSKLRSSLNVAKLEQVYEDKTHVYLVMEMCRGPTLAERSADEDLLVPSLILAAGETLHVCLMPWLDPVHHARADQSYHEYCTCRPSTGPH